MRIDLLMMSRLGFADGGRETWLNTFIGELGRRNRKCEISFFSLRAEKDNVLSDNEDRYPHLLGDRIEIDCPPGRIPIPVKFWFGFVKKFLFRKTKADYLLAVGGLNEAIAVACSRLRLFYNPKRIIWLRTVYSKEKGYRLNSFTRRLVIKLEVFVIRHFFDGVIANGEDTAAFYRAYGIDCTVIHNAVDLERWKQQIPVAPTNNKVRIAFIGRLSQVKGIEAFLKSIDIALSKTQKDQLEFHVVGDGPYRNMVQMAAENGSLYFHGAMPNQSVPEFLKKIDCCVALTYSKDLMGGGGVSNALIEQMASEKIIVAWRNEIFCRVLSDDSCFFIDQDDVEALAETYCQVAIDREGAKVKAQQAKAVSENYSIRTHVDKFFAFLNEIK
ncbi:hypothetical protein GCM10023144_25120 [Pigmentiphaga soli]|uniref:Glycosyltransferase subfamily 4-like N-terminal domain-containing protein n=1 Tax=Pigmentiphaga soli TaxID=1007095 RepID=A0ABP8H3B4_9BURK